ncbi:MAG TPA: hypothetical protein VII06_19735 [Chloroflexota bacterium]|jgi:hypothetical protein
MVVALVALAAALGPPPARAQDLIHAPATPLDQSTVQLVVDSRQPLGQIGDPDAGPSYRLRGWAIDQRATGSPGIRQIVAYLDGPSDRGRLLGWARYGMPRPDVGTVFNNPTLAPCGFDLTWPVSELPLQVGPVRTYTLFLYLETADGWVLARVPVAVTLTADSTPEDGPAD